ncbi:YqcC family protein [Rodentibacter sp. Ppn85]|uniref:YqcC family protein n=1 Tax=Rodentibacter sp. Ppn85 TaxID=1908525 RepID=UPI0009856680|nr:YqcC family protein [Rodentibacter sp. Ppn85]OOF62686.1 anhydro-N-acetylmuramic acid kinase [Rodentibacter sp. Ppn85]
MRNQTKLHLDLLQQTMQSLNLWQSSPPAREAFLSEEPFSLDMMAPEEWLQWVFIPRMYALLESGAPLPSQIAISPYIEEALKEFDGLTLLLAPLLELEKLLQNQ